MSPEGRKAVETAENLLREKSQKGRELLDATKNTKITERDDSGGPSSSPGNIDIDPNNPYGDVPPGREGEVPDVDKCDPNYDALMLAIALAHEAGHQVGGIDEAEGGTNIHDNENPVRKDLGVSPRLFDNKTPVVQ